VVVAGKRWVPEIFPLIAIVVVIVVDKTYHMMAVVVIVMGMICIWSFLTRLLLPEQLSNLNLSGVLPY